MPNRILRDGILTSPKLARLGWPDEVFYRRLMSVVDDFGRYYADPGMLRAACYPRQLSKVSDSDVGKWLHACADAGLVRVYPALDGESYLELLHFRQQVRAKASKFPDPETPVRSTCLADATQVQSNARLDVDVDVDVCVDGSKGSAPLSGTPAIVVAAYHAALPDCRRVSTMPPKRKKRILAAEKLAKQVCREQGWDYEPESFWAGYFAACQTDPWRSGKVHNPKNEAWRQNLDVLIREDHFTQIMDEAIEALKEAA